ncbi:MAG TPA: hypothetical protein VMV45_18255 [Casimicrobiaceae bacterium]|nr:hypothetical protein [Casimicrobiaceae bacterium]
MASSTPPPVEPPAAPIAPVASERQLDTVAAQIAAIDEIIGLASHEIRVFDVDLSQCGWNSVERSRTLTEFFKRAAHPKLDIIVHDTRWIETSGARLCALLRQFGHAITIYTTGAEARSAMDPLVIVDARHVLHRFHVSQPRASLLIEQPQLAKPLVTRFEEIWATGEPGLTATVLGL